MTVLSVILSLSFHIQVHAHTHTDKAVIEGEGTQITFGHFERLFEEFPPPKSFPTIFSHNPLGEKNVKIWVHDGKPFFYIDIL